MKGQQVEDYFATISNQILSFSESLTARKAMHSFRRTFKTFKAETMADHGGEKAAMQTQEKGGRFALWNGIR